MTSPEQLRLGYIGLGNMGAPMAKRLVDWPGGVMVFDVRAEAMTPLTDAGAPRPAASPRWPPPTSSA
ncbi:putative oxidoreductase [Mycobacterium talmoniae]|uniref:Putative oxidoreductase n=1 Tax=Mycobacterium talmoniae TaxID=1858794 RepID=A0A2S8BRI5_9MYCO|nr:putative oxidoreductase [Mycobacterium talmoniae]